MSASFLTNYFYDLPEDLQQMIWTKSRDLERKEKDFMLSFIKDALSSIWMYRDGFMGPHPLNDFAEVVFDHGVYNDSNDCIFGWSPYHAGLLSDSDEEESIISYNPDDENPNSGCDECGDDNNGYGMALYERGGHWLCAGCMSLAASNEPIIDEE